VRWVAFFVLNFPACRQTGLFTFFFQEKKVKINDGKLEKQKSLSDEYVFPGQ
jgi:hypothetical protein